MPEAVRYSDQITIRCAPELTALVDRAASRKGVKASEWLRGALHRTLQLEGFSPETEQQFCLVVDGAIVSGPTFKPDDRPGWLPGTGDGSTTFNLPDFTGRICAMKEGTATRLTSTYFGGDSTALGAVGGGQSNTIVSSNVPSVTASVSGTVTVSAGGSSIPVTTRSWNNVTVQSGSGIGNIPSGLDAVGNATSLSGSNTLTGTAGNASPSPMAIVQPTFIVNKILRVI